MLNENENQNTPYSHLTPELILAAIESVGFQCTGGLSSLNSYENRVYQVGIEDSEPLIAKFYRPHRWSPAAIIEEHQFAIKLAEQEIPVVAPISYQQNTLHYYQEYHFALFPRVSGRALELDNLDHLEWMGRFLGRIHAVGACDTFIHRPRLDTETLGHIPFQFLLKDFFPEHIQSKLSETIKPLLATIEKIFKEAHSLAYIRLHGDFHPGNILWKENGPYIVDLDDCMMGPAVQDIWMMLSGDELKTSIQLERILSGYREFHDFNTAELRLIEPLRALRLLNYAAWLGKRWDDPTFPFHFPFFNTEHYWQEFLHNLQLQQQKLEALANN